jgi:SPP1 gp7 family putative phage head morphogenesis protein
MEYWARRSAEAQEKLLEMGVAQTEAQIKRYYQRSFEKILGQFQLVYEKVISRLDEGQDPTPADLYKLDAYWQLQGQLEQELTRLGDKEAALLSRNFEKQFIGVYETLAIKGLDSFSTLDKNVAKQMISEIWCADGKSWDQRIWTNNQKLKQTLNDHLIYCVSTGKKTSELKKLLREDFGVSYGRADRIVRTEMAHIQTQAAKKRYEDYGLRRYEILGNDDDSCGNHSADCHEMNGKKFLYAEMNVGKNAPPFHPNCKCCIVPVVE